jgi:hypothetical protein
MYRERIKSEGRWEITMLYKHIFERIISTKSKSDSRKQIHPMLPGVPTLETAGTSPAVFISVFFP